MVPFFYDLNKDMEATILWLNGPSRQDLLTAFPLQEKEVGCNFIRREYFGEDFKNIEPTVGGTYCYIKK